MNIGIQAEIFTICNIFRKHFEPLHIEAVFTRTRKREVAEIRQIIETLLYRHSEKKPTYERVGQSIMRGRHHSTVIHSVKTVEDFCHIDKKYNSKFQSIVRDFKATQGDFEVDNDTEPNVLSSVYQYFEY